MRFGAYKGPYRTLAAMAGRADAEARFAGRAKGIHADDHTCFGVDGYGALLERWTACPSRAGGQTLLSRRAASQLASAMTPAVARQRGRSPSW